MSNGVPQFATAEYSARAADVVCKSCAKALGEPYYRVNGMLVCAKCTQLIQDQMPADSHPMFMRGISFGVGGAILGFGIYVVFALATGLTAGIISLAVGYLVGKAIIMGSKGARGRRYQIAAVLLTYLAVSLSAVPIYISQQIKHQGAQQPSRASDPTIVPAPQKHPIKALGVLALIGVASPILELADPVHGLIGLVILFVGLRIAWRITAGRSLDIVGPIHEPAPAAPG